jgi:hypothetical protein
MAVQHAVVGQEQTSLTDLRWQYLNGEITWAEYRDRASDLLDEFGRDMAPSAVEVPDSTQEFAREVSVNTAETAHDYDAESSSPAEPSNIPDMVRKA